MKYTTFRNLSNTFDTQNIHFNAFPPPYPYNLLLLPEYFIIPPIPNVNVVNRDVANPDQLRFLTDDKIIAVRLLRFYAEF